MATDALKLLQELEAGAYLILSKLHEQIEDIGIWAPGETAQEGYLQQVLRELHQTIEQSLCDLIEHPNFREDGHNDKNPSASGSRPVHSKD